MVGLVLHGGFSEHNCRLRCNGCKMPEFRILGENDIQQVRAQNILLFNLLRDVG